MFSIDGFEWRGPCDIERVSRMAASEVSGVMLDGRVFNDVLGQYLRYEVTVAVPLNRREEYAQLYELLTQPVDGHRFVLPYNGGTVSVTGRVEDVRDEYVYLPDGSAYWKGTCFTVAANHPTKEMALGEVLTRGRAPVPEVASPEEGDGYVFRDGSWVAMETYEDAEGMRF